MMRWRHGVAGALALLLSCSGPRSTTASHPAPSIKAQARPPGVALLEDNCLACHTETDGVRPELGPTMAPAMALRSLRAVLSRQMPPPDDDDLEEVDRAALATWLCHQSGSDTANCDALVRHQFPTHRVHSGATVLAGMRRLAPGRQSVLEPSWRSHAVPGFNALDPTTIALIVGMAADVCRRPAPSAAAAAPPAGKAAPPATTPETVAKCIDEIVKFGLEEPAVAR